MRGIQTTIFGFLSLPLLVLAAPVGPIVVGPGQSKDGPSPLTVAPAATSASTTITASVIVPTSTFSPETVNTTETTSASSYTPPATTNSESISSSQSPSPTETTSPTESTSYNSLTSKTITAHTSSSSLTMDTMSTGVIKVGTSNHRRSLVIVLSTVLGFVGLVSIIGSLFIVYRYRKNQSPFGHRGATPIDDEEIASWRQNFADQKRPQREHLAAVGPEVSSITPGSPFGWPWTASPNSVQTVLSPSSAFLNSPPFLARAPNSRAGLTDDAVPGADPFIPIKRQSSRLSKPPPGHVRTKSRRSSLSAKSVGSFKWQNRDGGSSDSKAEGSNFSCFDPEDESVISQMRTYQTNNSNGTSVLDGCPIGGLSPRPQPRQDGDDRYIGRAIG